MNYMKNKAEKMKEKGRKVLSLDNGNRFQTLKNNQEIKKTAGITDYGSDRLNERYINLALTLDAEQQKSGTKYNVIEDAKSAMDTYINTALKSLDVLGGKGGRTAKDYLAAADNVFTSAVQNLVYKYRHGNKDAAQLKQTLEDSGYRSEKDTQRQTEANVIQRARDMGLGELTEAQQEKLKALQDREQTMNNMVDRFSGNSGTMLSQSQERQDLQAVKGIEAMESGMPKYWTEQDTAMYRNEAQKAREEAQKLKTVETPTLKEAETYLRGKSSAYTFAKDHPGDMSGYMEAFSRAGLIAKKAQEQGVDKLNGTEREVYDTMLGVGELPMAGGKTLDELTDADFQAMDAWGREKAQALQGVNGLYLAYQPTDEQQYLLNLYRDTPEGAQEYLEDAKGTAEEEAAKKNYYFVSRRTKYDEVPTTGNWEEDSKAKEDFSSGDATLDRYYRIINNIGGARDQAEIVQSMNGGSDAALEFFYNTGEKDQGTFNALMNRGQFDDARDYLDYMQYSVNAKIRERTETAMYNLGNAGGWKSAAAGIASIPMDMMRFLGTADIYAQNIRNALVGDDGYRPVDVNTGWQLPGAASEAADKGILDKYDWKVHLIDRDYDVFDALYSTVKSGVSSYAIGALSRGLGFSTKTAEAIASIWMGSNAAQGTMQDIAEAGGDNAQILIGGTLAGIFEGAFEKVSIGELFKDMDRIGSRTIKEGLKNVGKEALVNFSEEFNTEIANIVMEYFLMGDLSDQKQKYDEYIRLGATEEEAQSMVWRDMVDRAMEAGLSGALIGAGFGEVANINARKEAGKINKAVGSWSESFNATLKEAAEGLGGEAAALAKTYDPKKAKNKDTGNLYLQVFRQLPGQYKGDMKARAQTEIQGLLADGDQQTAEAIATIMSGEELNTQQLQTLARNKNGMAAVYAVLGLEAEDKAKTPKQQRTKEEELSVESGKLGSESPIEFERAPWQQDARRNVEPVDYVRDADGKYIAPEEQRTQPQEARRHVEPVEAIKEADGRYIGPETAKPAERNRKKEPLFAPNVKEAAGDGLTAPVVRRTAADNTQEALEENAQEADQNAGEALSAPTVQLTQGESQEARRKQAPERAVKGADGKAPVVEITQDEESGTLEAVREDGTRESIEDAGFTDDQKTLAQEAAGLPQSAQAAMTRGFLPGQNARDYSRGFKAIYESMARGAKAENVQSLYADTMTQEQRDAAIKEGQIAYEENRAADEQATREAAKDLKQRTGVYFRVLADGESTRGGVFLARVRQKISDTASTMLQLIHEMAEDYGFQVRVYDTLGNKNGEYVAGTNIINLSLDAEEGMLTRATSHELFHLIKQWNQEAGARLQKQVLEALKNAPNFDLENRVAEIQEKYQNQAGQKLDRDAAEEEIAANAMLDQIGTEEGLKNLVKGVAGTKDSGLLTKIENWLSSTIQKMKDMLDRIAWRKPEVRALKDNVEYFERIHTQFKTALDTAMDNYRAAKKGLYEDAANDADVQQYLQDIQGDVTAEDVQTERNALAARLFARYALNAGQAIGNAWEESLEKFKEALAKYTQGGVSMPKAFEDSGIPAPEKGMYPVLAYAGRQMAEGEEQAKQTEGVKYSVQETENGTKYVEVDTDQDIFEGKTVDEMPAIIQRYIKKKFGGRVIGTGDNRAYVNGRTAGKYTNDGTRYNPKTYENKMRAGTELDNLLDASTFIEHRAYDPHHEEFANGWDIYKTIIHARGEWYEGTISVGIYENGGKLLYSVNVKKSDAASFALYALPHHKGGAIALNDSISNSGENVNKKFDLKDEEYVRALESGNEETAQQMVDEAAEAAGYTEKVYHGTPNSGFTQFRDWSFFTPNKAYADLYQRGTYSSMRGVDAETATPGTYELYMKPGKVFDTRKAEDAELYKTIRQEMGLGELGDKGLPDWNDAGDIIEYIEENGLNYDTIALDEGGTMGEGDTAIERGISYASKNTQIKDAAAVTYDDNGNVIPLSKRFNQGQKDIRYDIKDDAQARQDRQALEDLQADVDFYAQAMTDEETAEAVRLFAKIYRNLENASNDLVGKITERENWKYRKSEIAKRLITETGSKMKLKDVESWIGRLFTALDKGGYNLGETLMYARELGTELIKQSPGMELPMDETTKSILSALKNNKFYLTDDQKSEIRGTYGNLQAYLRTMFGKTNIVKKGANVSDLGTFWRETLNPMDPGTFAEDTSELDMPGILAAWMETANQPKYSAEFGQNAGHYATSIGLELMGEYLDMPWTNQRVNALKNQYDRELKNIRQNYQGKYEERVQAASERRKKTEARNKVINEIKREVRKVRTRVMNASDSRHIPEELRGAAEAFLHIFDSDRAIFSGYEIQELANKYRLLAENGALHDTEAAAKYDPDIDARLQWLGEKMKDGSQLRNMDQNDLNMIKNITDHITNLFESVNSMEVAGRQVRLDESANEFMAMMREHKEAKIDKAHKAGRGLAYREMTPVYFAKRVGGIIKDVIDDMILNGQQKYAFHVRDTKQTMGDLVDQYHVNKWINGKNHLQFDTVQGDHLELNKEQAMTLYAWWKREQSNTLQNAAHLKLGGFTYDLNDKDTQKYKGVNLHKSHVLSQADMYYIEDYLGEEGKNFVDAMVDYLSHTVSEWGNETSMALFGWKKYGENYYFPYPTDAQFRGKNLAFGSQGQNRKLKNISASHALLENAHNPLKLGNFTDIWAGHVDEMAMYNAFAEKLDNLERVTNYVNDGTTTAKEDGTLEITSPESAKKLMAQAMGEEAVRYLEGLINDVNGGVRGDERSPSGKLFSLFKKGSVAANLSVMLQQPSAFVRAMNMVSAKYFVKGLSPRDLKGVKARMYENSGAAVIKDMGRFDTNMGKSSVEWMTDRIDNPSKLGTAYDWMDKITGFGAEKADEVTWCWMYSAIENEVEDTTDLVRGTEEFNKAVGQRFDAVMTQTQVYDSTLAKSQWMRSTGGLDKMFTSFMGEPTLWTNMIMDAAMDWAEKKPNAGKKAAAAVGVFVGGTFVNAVLKSLATALRRKDDEGRTFLEKYLAEVTGNFIEDVSPFGIMNMVPLARDVVSLMQGYDVERADMALVSDLVNKVGKLVKKGDEASGEDWLNAGTAAANIFGIPARNVIRDVKGLWGAFFGGANASGPSEGRDIWLSILDNVGDTLKVWNITPYDSANKAYYDRMEQALIAGDMEKYNYLRGYVEETKQVKPDTVNSGIKSEIKGSVLGGLISDDKALDMLEKLGIEQDKAFDAVNQWTQEAAHADDENYSYKKFGELKDLIAQGADIQEESKRLMKYGVTQKQIDSNTKTAIRDLYKEGKLTDADAEGRIKNYLGVTKKEDIHWMIDQWAYERDNEGENYSKYVDVYEAVKNGTSLTAAMKEMTDNGYTEKDVRSEINSKIKAWYVDGELTRAQTESKLKQYAGITDENDLYWRMDELDYAKKNKDNKNAAGYKKYDSFYKAVETGTNLQSEVKRYTSHGVKAETMASQITSQYKAQYVELYKTNPTKAAELKARLLNAYAALGYDRNKKQKDIEKWLK